MFQLVSEKGRICDGFPNVLRFLCEHGRSLLRRVLRIYVYNNWCIHGLLLSERVVGYLVPLLKLIRKICQICRNGNHFLWGRNLFLLFSACVYCVCVYFLVLIFLCMFKAASILLILFSACAKLTGEPRYKWQIWALIKLIKFFLFKSVTALKQAEVYLKQPLFYRVSFLLVPRWQESPDLNDKYELC